MRTKPAQPPATDPVVRIRAALAAGNAREALSIAVKFPALGVHKAAITRAWEALVRPEMYRQMGRDCDALVAEGVAALKERYAA